MKITQKHREHMQEAIDALLDKHGKSHVIRKYSTGNFANSDKVKDLQKRFCFDLMQFAGLGPWVSATVYTYANDDHLLTALKSVCPKVSRTY